MANMQDKLKGLMGKKIMYNGGTIYPFSSGNYYHKIIEVGDDYFVVDMIRDKGEKPSLYPITYAISEVSSIRGGL